MREALGESASAGGRHAPDQTAEEERAARPETIADPAAEHLKQQIGIGEGRKHKAKLGIRQLQFALDGRRGGADIDAIDVGNEIHDAKKREHHMRRFELRSHLSLPNLRLLACVLYY